MNSLWLSTVTAGLSVLMAVPMAWAVSRTDMPGKGFIWGVVLGAFVLPPYLGAIGWILLAGPNAGFINQAWRWVTGAEAPLVNVYTFTGLATVIALQSFPLIFIFVKSALDLISSEMEDAANILGAGTWTVCWFCTSPFLPAQVSPKGSENPCKHMKAGLGHESSFMVAQPRCAPRGRSTPRPHPLAARRRHEEAARRGAQPVRLTTADAP